MTKKLEVGSTAQWPNRGYFLADGSMLRYRGKTETSLLRIKKVTRLHRLWMKLRRIVRGWREWVIERFASDEDEFYELWDDPEDM